MMYRVIGTVLVICVLAVLAAFLSKSEDDAQPQATQDDPGFRN